MNELLVIFRLILSKSMSISKSLEVWVGVKQSCVLLFFTADRLRGGYL